MPKPPRAKRRSPTAVLALSALAAVAAEICLRLHRLSPLSNISSFKPGLCRSTSRRYNQRVVARSPKSSSLFVLFLMGLACWSASCATSLGPGYVVEKQQVQVSFVSQAEPRIRVIAEYHLKNTGNQVLDSLDVRLPGRRFHPGELAVLWDGAAIPQTPSADNPRDTLLRFPEPWVINSRHIMRFAYDIRSNSAEQRAIAFSADAFDLPAESWTPALPQARGVFGFGGVPPQKWDLVVRVPQGFLVHASGVKKKHSATNVEMEFRFEQTAQDFNPFVVAGRYRETRQQLVGNQHVVIWSRAAVNSQDLQRAGE